MPPARWTSHMARSTHDRVSRGRDAHVGNDERTSRAGTSRRVKIVNETDFSVRLRVPNSAWSCDDFSGTDNPSQLNGLVIDPNPRTPLIVTVSARWNAPNVPVGIQGRTGAPDLPWVALAAAEWGAGGFYGYAPVSPGSKTLGAYPLVEPTGTDRGLHKISACNHQGQEERDTFNAIRFWPTGWKQCDPSASVSVDGQQAIP